MLDYRCFWQRSNQISYNSNRWVLRLPREWVHTSSLRQQWRRRQCLKGVQAYCLRIRPHGRLLAWAVGNYALLQRLVYIPPTNVLTQVLNLSALHKLLLDIMRLWVTLLLSLGVTYSPHLILPRLCQVLDTQFIKALVAKNLAHESCFILLVLKLNHRSRKSFHLVFDFSLHIIKVFLIAIYVFYLIEIDLVDLILKALVVLKNVVQDLLALIFIKAEEVDEIFFVRSQNLHCALQV